MNDWSLIGSYLEETVAGVVEGWQWLRSGCCAAAALWTLPHHTLHSLTHTLQPLPPSSLVHDPAHVVLHWRIVTVTGLPLLLALSWSPRLLGHRVEPGRLLPSPRLWSSPRLARSLFWRWWWCLLWLLRQLGQLLLRENISESMIRNYLMLNTPQGRRGLVCWKKCYFWDAQNPLSTRDSHWTVCHLNQSQSVEIISVSISENI